MLTIILGLLLCSPSLSGQEKELKALLNELNAVEAKNAQSTNPKKYISLLNEIGLLYDPSNKDSLYYYSIKALHLSKEIGYVRGETISKLNLSIYYDINGDSKNTIKMAREAQLLAQKIGSDSLVVSAMNLEAISNAIFGNYAEAFKLFHNCIEIAEKNKDYYNLQKLNNNLAHLFMELKVYDRAETYLNRGFETLPFLKDSIFLKAMLDSKLGEIYLRRGEFKKGEGLLSSSIRVFREQEQPYWEIKAYNGLGKVFLNEKKLDSSLHYYKKAKALFDNIDEFRIISDINGGMAHVLFEMGKYKTAEQYALVATKQAKKVKYIDGWTFAAEVLQKIHKKNGDIAQAYKYLDISQKLSDSLKRVENEKVLLVLEAQTQFEKEKEKLDFENAKKLEKQKLISYLVLVLFISACAIALLIRKNFFSQKKAKEKLEELNSTKDKIFAIIGHDLKTPIGTLQEFLELYRDKEISAEEIAKITPGLKSNVDHSAFTLNNLLMWATNQMKGTVTNPKPVPIKDHATQVVELYMEKIKKKGLEVECLTNPEMIVMVDIDHLDIILRNLILNAIKFTPKNGLIQFNGEEKGNTIVFNIKDTGIGMNPSQINSILHGKSISPRTGTNNERGTGIGLQITKELIELNKGKLEIESVPNVGTTVKITFAKA